MTQTETEFVTLKANSEFEISTSEPWIIRRKEDGFIPKFSKNNSGYLFGGIGGQMYLLHRLVGEQFVKNDDLINKTQIDHKNGVKDDNSIENLRWVSHSENQKNKTKHNDDIIYEYVDETPDDTITIDDYGTHRFEFYSYSEETGKFYYYNGLRYRLLHVNETKRSGTLFVIAYDSNNEKIRIYINKFKRLYNIIN
ncbi:MAG: hypothetical protein EZS28_038176 [Streblomastix strix]|uniref:HNH nuclease domain-containing protein n=1 Tax=Streblomastix strix TaxID=222440 RepID=A0A5J4U7M1_9EUKA|nr:MAG: hypothetical protein EZS28_038176 [Streblomastix strix]